jgi:hypothetical protein
LNFQTFRKKFLENFCFTYKSLNPTTMTTLEKQAYLKKVFGLGVASGVIRTLKDLAEQLEVDASGLSSAMNGRERNLTDRLIRKVQKWAMANGLEDENGEMKPVQVKPAEPDIVIPAATAAMYTNMTETIRIQAEIIARLQAVPTQPYAAGIYAPKNLRTDK